MVDVERTPPGVQGYETRLCWVCISSVSVHEFPSAAKKHTDLDQVNYSLYSQPSPQPWGGFSGRRWVKEYGHTLLDSGGTALGITFLGFYKNKTKTVFLKGPTLWSTAVWCGVTPVEPHQDAVKVEDSVCCRWKPEGSEVMWLWCSEAPWGYCSTFVWSIAIS